MLNGQKRCSMFLYLLRLVCDMTYNQSQRKFSTGEIYVFLLLDGMFCLCLLYIFGLMDSSSPKFPYGFSIWILYPLLNMGY